MDYTIYKITIVDNADLCYVGSTNKLKRRISQHKNNCNNNNKLKLYQAINQNGGWSNCVVETLETININDVKKVREREEELRIEHKASLNTIKAYMKEELSEYHKQYVQKHKDHLRILWHKNYEKNREKTLQKYLFKKEFKRLSNINL
jgi:hypothetical protein